MPDNQLLHGDSREVLKTLATASVDSVVTDPPSGISFMSKKWDNPDSYELGEGVEAKGDRAKFVEMLRSIMAEALRVLKPGGHAFVWALPRTSHWTALALEDAGFDLRDCVYHVFGCLSEDTEMFTEAGWTKYTALKVGQLALCHDIVKDTWTWEPIEEVVTYAYNETAYHIHGYETDQIVSKNHRCLVVRNGDLAFELAENLRGEELVPVTIVPRFLSSEISAGQDTVMSTVFSAVKVEPVPYEGIVWCVRVPTGASLPRSSSSYASKG